MMRNHFTLAIRSILKSRFFSLLNILGLVFGMTAAFLICFYVWYDFGYDGFHTKKDRIFRVKHDRYTNGELTRQWVAGPMSIGEDLKGNFPEVVHYTRMVRQKSMFSRDDVLFREDNVFFASEDFFRMFSFPLLSGIDSLVLSNPNSMVVSESLAKRYFGNEDPVGRTIINNGKEIYEVVGVFRDLPENTHMKIEALISFASYLILVGPEEAQSLREWWWDGYYTYIELAPGVDAREFQSKIPAFVEKKMGAELREYNEGMAFSLQPLTDVHLYSNFKDEMGPNGDGKANGFLILVAVFILVMAWINYINLSAAKSMGRVKEIGVRKVMGSNRIQLVRRFLMESLVLKLIALLITLTTILLVLPYFSEFVNRKLTIELLLSPLAMLFVAAVLLLSIALSALYPALVISRLTPTSILRGNFKTSSRGNGLRRILVFIQFTCSIVLIIGTFAVHKQVSFIRHRNLGIETDQVLVVYGPNVRGSNYVSRYNTFQQSLLQYPSITAISRASGIPGQPSAISNGGVRIVGHETKGGNSFRVIMTDEDYVNLYNLKILSGRNFAREFNDHWRSVMVNETAMNLLGLQTSDEALNKKVILWGDTLQIVGVLRDFHHESPKKKVDQLIFICDYEISDYYAVKTKAGGSLQSTVSEVEEQYGRAFPGNAFRFFFLSDSYSNQYQSDIRFGKVFGLFSIVAIVIACLGLFGLSSYMTIQRTKEVGIRKVLGASVRQVTVLLSKEFFILILLANILAWPIAYFTLDFWLTEFASRIDLSIVNFLLPAVATMLIALGTVAIQFVRIATSNPVDTLRTE